MGNTYENARANVLIKISKLTIPPQKDYNMNFLTYLFLLKLFSQVCKRYKMKEVIRNLYHFLKYIQLVTRSYLPSNMSFDHIDTK